MPSELDENSEDERKKVLAASKQQAAFVDVQSMDDEVERVLSHRCAPRTTRSQTLEPRTAPQMHRWGCSLSFGATAEEQVLRPLPADLGFRVNALKPPGHAAAMYPPPWMPGKERLYPPA